MHLPFMVDSLFVYTYLATKLNSDSDSHLSFLFPCEDSCEHQTVLISIAITWLGHGLTSRAFVAGLFREMICFIKG